MELFLKYSKLYEITIPERHGQTYGRTDRRQWHTVA